VVLVFAQMAIIFGSIFRVFTKLIFVQEEKGKERNKMSVSKWAYTPEKCDGDYCPGDCDNCSKANEDESEDNEE